MLADILEETPIEDDPKDMTLFGPTRPLDTHLGLRDLAPPPSVSSNAARSTRHQ